MKKFLKILGITVLSIAVILYIGFLFVLPNVVDVNQYKPMIQQIVKEQAQLNLDFGEVKITTTPLLSAGIKTDNITLKYDDGQEIFAADSLKTRVSLPSLLLLTVKVSCFEVENPRVDLTIEDRKNLKILQHFDKILTEQEKNIGEKPKVEEQKPPFDVSMIRIVVPAAKLKNYKVKVTDVLGKHDLTLSGDELVAGYFNGKTARLKTDAKLCSDNNTKITTNIDIDTFLPPPSQLDEEDDKMQRAELPYANVVEIYRKYDLKANLNTKLKIREKNGAYKMWGFVDLDDLSLNLSNYTLPKSYAFLKFKNQKVFMDTDISVATYQNIKLLGFVNYSKNPKIGLKVKTGRIYFKSVLDFAKGVLDTFQVKNNLASINTDGYIYANTDVKTNFKKLKSEGVVFVRRGNFINKKTGLNINSAKADIYLDNNTLDIKEAKMFVDKTPFTLQGSINEKSIADIKINTENMPLKGLYNTFAPYDLKKNYSLNSAFLTINADLQGELKKSVANASVILKNLSFSDKPKSLVITNEQAEVSVGLAQKLFSATVKNKNLQVSMPQTSSSIKNPDLKIDIDTENIVVNPAKLVINNNSIINYSAQIQDWMKKFILDFNADGKLNAQDLKKFAGKDAAMFIDAKGAIPLSAKVSGTGERQNILLQILTDSNNYISPVDIQDLKNKNGLIQAEIAYKGDRIKIKNTGLFERKGLVETETGEKRYSTNKIVGIEGTIVKLNTPTPFINLFTIDIPKDLNVKVNGFKNATFDFGGNLFVFGNADSPRYKGGFYINNMNISDLLVTMKKANIDLVNKNLRANVEDLLLNGSDVAVEAKMSMVQTSTLTIDEVNVTSKNIDIDKMMKVAEAATKFAPKSSGKAQSSQPADIPVWLKTGNLSVGTLKTGNIVVKNISGLMSLSNNVFNLNRLRADVFDGNVLGDIGMDLSSNILHVVMNGSGIDSNKALIDAANLKNMISGKLSFDTDFTMNAAASTYEEQMKSINCKTDFLIENGQLGPFGKLENMIVAENIRESEFFKTALGGVISNLTTIDTTHFAKLGGHVDLENAIVKISSITSSGNVLNLYLIGDMDILKNTIDMKLRANLGSDISNMLGPIAQLNPINLVKSTPGLNIVMAKSFALFCETVSIAELSEIPAFENKYAEEFATKFQIVLKGDVAKPLTLVKSFKWLVTEEQMTLANNFVASLPEPEVDNKGNVLTTAEEINAYNSKRSTKIRKAVKKFFSNLKKEKKLQPEVKPVQSEIQ